MSGHLNCPEKKKEEVCIECRRNRRRIGQAWLIEMKAAEDIPLLLVRGRAWQGGRYCVLIVFL